MAAEGKKEFKVTVKFAPWQEVKGGKPAFLDMIPGHGQFLAPGLITHKLEVDPRKWKQKDLDYEAYGMAKPTLQLFAVKLHQIQKQAESQLPPVSGNKRDWASIAKSKAPMDKKVAKEASDKLKKTWPKLYKEIENAISLRMEDIEADKGDNKKALSSTKDALAKFKSLNTSTMFSKPVDDLVSAMKKLSTDIAGTNPDTAKALKEVQKKIDAVQKDVDQTAKQAKAVAKYFVDSGKRMSKDVKSDPAFQKVGQVMLKESTSLQEMADEVDYLDDLVKGRADEVKNEGITSSEARESAKFVEDAGRAFAKTLKSAIESVKAIEKQFNEAQKDVKKS